MKTIPGRILAILFVILLSISLLTILNVNAQPYETIYIKSDGTIEPNTAPIEKTENKYKLTESIDGRIVIEKHRITIDGNGYTLQGDGTSSGIYMIAKQNITIQNLRINNHKIGINLIASRVTGNPIEYPQVTCDGITISDSIISNNDKAVYGDVAHNTALYGNHIYYNSIGLHFFNSFYTILKNNSFLENEKHILAGNQIDMDDSNIIDGIPVTTPTPAPTSTPTLTPALTPEPEFPAMLVLTSVVIIVVAGVGIFVYFKKRRS